MSASLNCSKAGSLFSGYLDGAISGREMQAVAAHLEHCEGCATEFAQWRGMQSLLAHAAPAKVPDKLGLQLRLAISHESSRHQGFWHSVSATWENLVRPIALQAASGLVGTVLLVGGTAALVGIVPVSNEVLAHDEPLRAVTMPHYLYTAEEDEPLAPALQDATVVVEADVSTQGKVYGYDIVSGPVDAETRSAVRDELMLQVYEPAKMFGVPVRGRVLVTFSGVLVKG